MTRWVCSRRSARPSRRTCPRRSSGSWRPLASDIGSNDIYKIVVTHPLVRAGFDVRGSIQLPDFKKIAALGAAMFTPVGTRPTDKYVSKAPTTTAKGPAQAAPRCYTPTKPKPAPKPTPKPTKKPTPKPSVKPSATPEPSAEPTPNPRPDRSAGSGPSASGTLSGVLAAGPVRPVYRSREAGREARSSVSAQFRRDLFAAR